MSLEKAIQENTEAMKDLHILLFTWLNTAAYRESTDTEKPVKPKKNTDKKAETKKEEEKPENKTEEIKKEEAEPPKKQNVIDALVSLKNAKGKPAAKSALEDLGAKKIDELKEEQYQECIDLCLKKEQEKEAA